MPPLVVINQNWSWRSWIPEKTWPLDFLFKQRDKGRGAGVDFRCVRKEKLGKRGGEDIAAYVRSLAKEANVVCDVSLQLTADMHIEISAVLCSIILGACSGVNANAGYAGFDI